MIEISKGLPNNAVGIAVNGRMAKKDGDDVLMPAMEKSFKRHDKIRLYYELNSRFRAPRGTISTSGSNIFRPCERVALVTDVGWIRYTVKALRFLIPGEIQVFASVQASEGRARITTTSGSPASAEASAPARRHLPRSRRPRSRTAMRSSRRWRGTG
jgi:hypothetical protein